MIQKRAKKEIKKEIRIVGAKEHNLKNINVILPRDEFIVITGLSGSGKSSLAIDTLFAEGQRRFIESLSSYARQFLGQKEKPKVESITGLSPAICIDQKTTSRNPRSTVGTITEIYDYLRVMYVTIGKPHCPTCGDSIEPISIQEIVDQIMNLENGTRIRILGPIIKDRKGEYKALFEELKADGFIRVRIDGEEIDLSRDEIPKLDRYVKHTIDVVIDRLVVGEEIGERVADSVELALKKGEGNVIVDLVENGEMVLSETGGCQKCNYTFPELEPRMFSFNSPHGACENCSGLGFELKIDPDLVIPDQSLSIDDGAIVYLSKNENSWGRRSIKTIANYYGFETSTPWRDLDEKFRNALLYGSGDEKITFEWFSENEDSQWQGTSKRSTEGIINSMTRRYHQTKSNHSRLYYESFMSKDRCNACNGARLKKEVLAVTVNDLNISQLTEFSVKEALDFLQTLKLSKRDQIISEEVVKEINERISFLNNVGLSYLTLNRAARTLSGGEAQRVRLATQIGSKLVGVLYVLDEPSIGLHQKDNEKLLNTFFELRDIGNTVVVIEHDEQTIRSADYIVDIGPKAGDEGGEVVFAGIPEKLINESNSLTAQYLRGERKIETPKERRKTNGQSIKIKNIKHNNLKDITIKIPLGVFCCVTGVSGSGKSSLVQDTIWRALARYFGIKSEKPGQHTSIEGFENLDKAILIDQSPIGKTPRSNPATYTKVWDHVRDLYAESQTAKKRGYLKGRFSFNVKGGRCETCKGKGYELIEMHFLPSVYVNCEVCHGKRFNRETLQVRYKGRNISEVLEMTIKEAHSFFENIPKIQNIMKTLLDVGMSYVKLGQASPTLSGGEAQRIKLSRELSKRTTGNTLIILDEPTTGLHMEDLNKLLQVLQRLVDAGNTILIVEHNLDVIKSADWIIDLGPDGGNNGGEIIIAGTPEQIAKCDKSYTGQYLKRILT
jgi:excinuclease ABC subunit A